MPHVDYDALLPSWELDLRARNKSPKTVLAYLDSLKAYRRWCETSGTAPDLTKRSLQQFAAESLRAGAAEASVSLRQIAVRLFVQWLMAEGEIDGPDPTAGIGTVTIGEQIVDPLTEDEIRAMLATCRTNGLIDRRDEAIMRFMLETLARSSETVGMLLSEMNIPAGTAVLHGKGNKQRLVAYGPQTARAIDRYMRVRRSHPLAGGDRVWVGRGGKLLGYSGLYMTLAKRAEAAGVVEFHPHRFRHTGADRWLDRGGSEGGLMAVGGWEDLSMLRRYTKRRSAVRAIDESRRLDLGNI